MTHKKNTPLFLLATLCAVTCLGCPEDPATTPADMTSDMQAAKDLQDTSDSSEQKDETLDTSNTKDTSQDISDIPDDTSDASETSDMPDMSTTTRPPNILLIIADDLGIDSSAQFSVSTDLPDTPTLNKLASEGLVFENAWATPACTTTRGTLISGLHGVHSGVDRVPDTLETSVFTLHKHLKQHTPTLATAIIGKWHLSAGDSDPQNPIRAGVGYYAGTILGTIDDYNKWPLTIDGMEKEDTRYHTSAMTDIAIDWIGKQNTPWFLWLAHVAPHAPFHLPPKTLHDRNLSGARPHILNNRRDYYLAAVEAMDTEIERLLNAIPPEERERTIIIFLGDNGTPSQAVDPNVFDRMKAKNTLYEGGVRVPWFMTGPGITRKGEREPALINTADLFPTIAEMLGIPQPTSKIDGVSFAPLLSDAQSTPPRSYNYSEFAERNQSGWTVRDERYKLIVQGDGTRELYDLNDDLGETKNLINEPTLQERIMKLEAYAAQIRAPL